MATTGGDVASRWCLDRRRPPVRPRHLREAPFPACVHDVHAALRYLAGYADELGIDAARMGVWGESAGAHLAWLAALVRADEAPGGIDLTGRTGLTGPRPRPRALVSWYGPSSLDRFVDEWPGAPPLDPVPGLLQALSPLTQVRRDAPATLIMHGCADTIVPVEHAHRLHEAMRRAGAASTLRIVPGAEHCFLGYPIEPLIHEALGFLLQHLASG
ncbi:MAG: hypothetical protein CSB46_01140 [Micrococcales bacterium]|nr:MAG: hypothetical protein CSB46_01140 [Micrococcales bacterium]